MFHFYSGLFNLMSDVHVCLSEHSHVLDFFYMTLELCLVFFFSPFVIKMYLHDLFVRFCFMCLLFIFFPNMRVIYSFSFFSYFEEREKSRWVVLGQM